MHEEGQRPDSITIVFILPVVMNIGSLRIGKTVHGKLIDMINKWPLTTWNAMIYGYGTHGHGKTAVELFNDMQKEVIKPNDITFLHVISACSHSGLAEEGICNNTSMKKDYDIEPTMDHY
ncbi:hypothetical protein Ddye_029344 [Dipteronia dyeriana]|uniref:Pentatricopeptide repeat-containing protein n=1 Tax=Dipteronia dyeriana TaxID=168575 RepID=A0AAD9TEE3_9ROSI|nr:hypothetical protein Ddye_029344 [Dipteronia dyeriana]